MEIDSGARYLISIAVPDTLFQNCEKVAVFVIIYSKRYWLLKLRQASEFVQYMIERIFVKQCNIRTFSSRVRM